MRNSLIFTLAALTLVASNLAHAGDGRTPLPSQPRVNVPNEEPYPNDSDDQGPPPQEYVQPQQPPVVINNYYSQAPDQYVAPGYGLDQGFDASFCQVAYTQAPYGIVATILAGDPDNGWRPLWQNNVGPNFINLRIIVNSLQINGGYCANFGVVDVRDYAQYGGDGFYPHPYGYRGDRRFGFGLGYGGGYATPRFIPGRAGFDPSLQYRRGSNPGDFVSRRGYGAGPVALPPAYRAPVGGGFRGGPVMGPRGQGGYFRR